MLKLTRQLFFTNPARGAEYMDFYEKTLYNHILASQDPNSGARVPVLLHPAARRRDQDLQQRLQQLRLLSRHGNGEQHQVRRQHLLLLGQRPVPSLDPASVRTTTTPLQYTATASTGTVTLALFYKLHGQRYTVYWRIAAALT
jgi:hypothetical protein